MIVYNKKYNEEKRRKLRNDMTEPEKLLWARIRSDSLGVRFRRQFGVGGYILDFYCPKLKIAVEIDGESHFTEEGMEYDKNRTDYLKTLDISLLRYNNNDIMSNIEAVILDIAQNLR